MAPKKIVADGIKSWGSFIVGFFIGKSLAYPILRKHLENRWKLREPLVMKLERNFFFIMIESEEVKRSILESGPIFILWRIFVLQKEVTGDPMFKLSSKLKRVGKALKTWVGNNQNNFKKR